MRLTRVQVWKDGKKVKEQVGANKDSLEALAKEFA